MNTRDADAFEEIDVRLRTMLPLEYQDTYEDMQPLPMGAAGLKFHDDGGVAWNDMWASFCDLAMAGGPPHKGALLASGAETEILARADAYTRVTAEMCRGVAMVTSLPVELSPTAGWVRVTCPSDGMAGWLVRAITMENVAVRITGSAIDLPASPSFRLDKEIKNVVTVMAKTFHYWAGHMPATQKRLISELIVSLNDELPLIGPDDALSSDDEDAARRTMSDAIARSGNLQTSPVRYNGWTGVECGSIRHAVWLMRALVVSNVLARREGTVLFVPVCRAGSRESDAVTTLCARFHELAIARGAQ